MALMHREFNENDLPIGSDTRGRGEKTCTELTIA